MNDSDDIEPTRRIARSGHGPGGSTAGSRDDGTDAPDMPPLELTLEMRIDEEPTPGDGERSAHDAPEADRAVGFARAAAAADRSGLQEIEKTVRDVVLDELAGGAADNLIRKVIRDELINGELGSNAARNVARLVRSELARAVKD